MDILELEGAPGDGYKTGLELFLELGFIATI